VRGARSEGEQLTPRTFTPRPCRTSWQRSKRRGRGAEDRDELGGDDGRSEAPQRVSARADSRYRRASGPAGHVGAAEEREGRRRGSMVERQCMREDERERGGGRGRTLARVDVARLRDDCGRNKPSRMKWMRVSNASQTEARLRARGARRGQREERGRGGVEGLRGCERLGRRASGHLRMMLLLVSGPERAAAGGGAAAARCCGRAGGAAPAAPPRPPWLRALERGRCDVE